MASSGAGVFGNVGRNRLLGPSLSQWDISFFKSFAITERFKAQFRAESFLREPHEPCKPEYLR